LRDVERTQALLHMIDVYSDDIVRDYTTIQTELKNYKIDLTKKPQLIVLTKTEGLDEDIVDDQIKTLKKAVNKTLIMSMSAVSGDGLKPLLYKLYEIVDQQRKSRDAEELEKDDTPIIRAVENEDAWQVEIEKNRVIIRGKKIERFANRTDFESEDGVRRLRDIMRKMAIIKTMEKKQVESGIKVYFGDNREDYLEY